MILAAFVHPPPLSICFLFVHCSVSCAMFCVFYVSLWHENDQNANVYQQEQVQTQVCFLSTSKQGLIGLGCSSSLEMTQRSEVGFSVLEVGMTNPHHRKSTEEYTLTERRRQRDTIKNDEWAQRAAEADDSSRQWHKVLCFG